MKYCLNNFLKKMHDLVHDFDSITPNVWMLNEKEWKEKLLKLPNWNKVSNFNNNKFFI